MTVSQSSRSLIFVGEAGCFAINVTERQDINLGLNYSCKKVYRRGLFSQKEIGKISLEMQLNGRHDIQHNDIQYNDTKHNDTQHNDAQHNDTQHNNTQHNDTKLNDTKHNDTEHSDTRHNGFVCDFEQKDIKYNNTQHGGLVCDTEHI